MRARLLRGHEPSAQTTTLSKNEMKKRYEHCSL